MPIMYIHGTSTTRGTPTAIDGKYDQRWQNLVAKELGYDLVDGSGTGIANFTIHREASEFIIKNSSHIEKVVIEWTYPAAEIVTLSDPHHPERDRALAGMSNAKFDNDRDNQMLQIEQLFLLMYTFKLICKEHGVKDLTYLVWPKQALPSIYYNHLLDDIPVMWNIRDLVEKKGFKQVKEICHLRKRPDNHWGLDTHRFIADLVIKNEPVGFTKMKQKWNIIPPTTVDTDDVPDEDERRDISSTGDQELLAGKPKN